MPIRTLCTDAQALALGFTGPHAQRRRDVLRETLGAFESRAPAGSYRDLAQANLKRWHARAGAAADRLQIYVLPGDWGDVTLALTQATGACFAVLNMAHPVVPGGAYAEGAVAQEENMFRRTDCHFSVGPDQLAPDGLTYTPQMTQLLGAEHGRVYLDTHQPRVCIRGAEDRSAPDLGYRWLADDEIFPYYELRAAAQDLREGSAFRIEDARRRIAAQLDTLLSHGVRHAVLGAFGCGAFLNPAPVVARLYREEIERRDGSFSVIAFAIYSAGYGPDNFTPFLEAFSNAA